MKIKMSVAIMFLSFGMSIAGVKAEGVKFINNFEGGGWPISKDGWIYYGPIVKSVEPVMLDDEAMSIEENKREPPAYQCRMRYATPEERDVDVKRRQDICKKDSRCSFSGIYEWNGIFINDIHWYDALYSYNISGKTIIWVPGLVKPTPKEDPFGYEPLPPPVAKPLATIAVAKSTATTAAPKPINGKGANKTGTGFVYFGPITKTPVIANLIPTEFAEKVTLAATNRAGIYIVEGGYTTREALEDDIKARVKICQKNTKCSMTHVFTDVSSSEKEFKYPAAMFIYNISGNYVRIEAESRAEGDALDKHDDPFGPH